jgi:hypothetical protein
MVYSLRRVGVAMRLPGVLLGTAGVHHVASDFACKGSHAAGAHGSAPIVDTLVAQSVKGSQSPRPAKTESLEAARSEGCIGRDRTRCSRQARTTSERR